MKILLTVLSFFVIEQILSQTPTAYPDNSPTLDDFRAMGVPPCDKIWTYEDYQKVIRLLDEIYEADKFSLPRANSPTSGDVFRRMTCFENFDYLADPSINIGKRLIDFEKLREIPPRLAIYYIEDTEPYERFGAELLECFILEAYVNQLGKNLYDEMKNQLGSRAEMPRFKSGYDAMNLAFIKSIDRLFGILESDYDRYEASALNAFGNKMFFLVSNIKNEAIRKQLRLRIKNLDRRHMTATVREILQELRQQL
ncbi:MAG: hypothetical protein D6714_03120 [Bacteroidetes bacterium]|nr:MAG: hypothetical protein D6714_03120 [Bacteroidota bacterium]